MKTTINKLENSKLELIVEVEASLWETSQKKAFDKLVKKSKLTRI